MVPNTFGKLGDELRQQKSFFVSRAAIDRDWNAALNIRRLGINLAATKVASEAPKL